MYNPQNTADRIKNLSIIKGITIQKMLKDCELGKNTLSSMRTRGSWLQANSLAKIADYFNVSTDYLLGRTNDPTPISTTSTLEIDSFILTMYNENKHLTSEQKEMLINMLEFFKYQNSKT